jgi:hypothetical protein
MENMILKQGDNVKKYWSKNEKVLGSIFPIFIMGVIGVGLYYILPPLVLIFQNLLLLMGLSVLVIGVPAVIISNWSYFILRYQVFIKKLWKNLVNSDPITIMEIQYSKWNKELLKLNKYITVMMGAKNELEIKMNDNEKVANKSFTEAKKAEEMIKEGKGDAEKLKMMSYKSGIIAQRRLDSNNTFIPRLKAIDVALVYVKKLESNWRADLELLKDDINQKKSDLKVLKSTASALDAAKSIINGNPNERALFEMANESYAEKLSSYVAEIKRFTEQAENWVYSKEIENAVMEDKSDKLLSLYNEETFKQLTDFRSLMEKDDNVKISFSNVSNKMFKSMDEFNKLP